MQTEGSAKSGGRGHDFGLGAPGRCSVPHIFPCTVGNSATEPYIVCHNLLLAHATAVKLYRRNYQRKQRGQIGISHVGQYVEPYSNSAEDKAASKRILDFDLGWVMEPLVFGEYPKSMRKVVKERLPIFIRKEKKLLKGSFDFIGINYYTSRNGKNDPESANKPMSYHTDHLALTLKTNKDGHLIGPKAEGSNIIFVYPPGIKKVLDFIKKNYGSIKIYITENGITEARNDTLGIDEALKDPHRIDFALRRLYCF